MDGDNEMKHNEPKHIDWWKYTEVGSEQYKPLKKSRETSNKELMENFETNRKEDLEQSQS